jgi:AP2-associated kinase
MHSKTPPVTHRDLKIENVLLADGLFKLCDFGSCTTEVVPPKALSVQEIRKIEEEIAKFTTLQYRAPEQCDLYQRRGLNEKVDIWALGVLLYKLCFYITPFEESGKMGIMSGIVNIPSHPTYSQEMKNLICM